MKTNERIRISKAIFETFEDDRKTGESRRVFQRWTGEDVGLDPKAEFSSVFDALKRACSANALPYSKVDWNVFESGENPVFEWQIQVDDMTTVPTDAQHERWRDGEEKLYALHGRIELEIVSVRGIDDEELEKWKNSL